AGIVRGTTTGGAWTTLSSACSFGAFFGVTIDSTSRVYAVCSGDGVYTLTGTSTTLTKVTGTGLPSSPSFPRSGNGSDATQAGVLTVDSGNNLYVATSSPSAIFKSANQGSTFTDLTTGTFTGFSTTGQSNAIAVDAAGNVFA